MLLPFLLVESLVLIDIDPEEAVQNRPGGEFVTRDFLVTVFVEFAGCIFPGVHRNSLTDVTTG